jgi:hypothetical protein
MALGVPYDVIASISHPLAMFVRAIDPETCLIVFSHGCDIEVYQWETHTAATIGTQTEELDELVRHLTYSL